MRVKIVNLSTKEALKKGGEEECLNQELEKLRAKEIVQILPFGAEVIVVYEEK